jgi:hypothetical protein
MFPLFPKLSLGIKLTGRLIGNERRRILDTIATFDPRGHQNIAIKLRQPGTRAWFTEGLQFKNWLKTPNSKLWLYGIPGALSYKQRATNQNKLAVSIYNMQA